MDLADWNRENKQDLASLYREVIVDALSCLHISPDQLHPVMLRLASDAGWQRQVIGLSTEGRPIYQFEWGEGTRQVFAWSQMHGDEPTASASLADLLSFFSQAKHSPWIDHVKKALRITIIPMLNPDGAAVCRRVNGQGIDINRDARHLQTPEGQLLKERLESLKPHFAFNLHDQDRTHSVGDSGKPTGFALMVPPANSGKTPTPERTFAMELLGQFLDDLQCNEPEFIPTIAQYDDSYSPRGFGDFSASLGIPTVLVEAGVREDDWMRQDARYLTWKLMVQTLDWLASSARFPHQIERFQQLPANLEGRFFDLMLRNVSVKRGNQNYQLDIAVQVNLHNGGAEILKLGDLGCEWGLKEFDATGYTWQSLKSLSEDQLRLYSDLIAQDSAKEAASPDCPMVGKVDGALSKNGKPEYFLLSGELICVVDGTRLCRWPRGKHVQDDTQCDQ